MSGLNEKIEELIAQNASDFQFAKLIKNDLTNYYKTLPEIFKKHKGKDFLIKHTKKIDTIISAVYYIATRQMFGDFFPTKNAVPLTIAALGSYGRQQLSPKSDIDIMFVYKETAAYNTKELIEKMYYLLLDTGLKLGHRVHEVEELESAADSDITIKTAILESRFIDGSKKLWITKVKKAIRNIRTTKQKEFITEKIAERRKYRKKYPIMMEPNLKEGVGGFRDANLVFWIGKMLYDINKIKDLPQDIVEKRDYTEFISALEFLFKVRAALHIVANRKTDQLILDYIPDVAKLIGSRFYSHPYRVFSRKVNKSLRTVWLYSRIWINTLTYGTIDIYKNYLKPKNQFKNRKEALEFLIANADKPYRSHPELNSALLHTKKSAGKNLNRLILKAFEANSTSSILTALSEVELLGDYIKPVKKIEAMPQFDGYHKYSVDTHLIKAVKALENIEEQKLKKIYNSLPKDKKLLLKLVTFLHDTGKGRKIDHHEIGKKIFLNYGKTLNLSQENIDLGAKLILYHNKLSVTAQKEDIYNPRVIDEFASIFNTKLELDMILLLTYADTTAVGSNIYNKLTSRLFWTLYSNALNFLSHREFLDEVAKKVKRKEAIQNSKAFKALPKTAQRKILNIESNLPFIKYSTSRIIEIAKRAINIDTYEYEVTNKRFLTIEIIKKIPLDLGYLLSKLSNLNLVNMDIVKLFDGKKYFKIDFNQKVTDDDVEDIKIIIKDSFEKQERIILPKPVIYKKDIDIECDHSKTYALMRFRANDQKGLLAYLMNIFEEYQIEIVSSKIYTRKNRVDDMFLLEKNGNYCKNLELIIEKFAQSTV